MSFGLKNVGATYQQAIQLCLTDQLHRNIEAYMDDMAIKARAHEKFISNLEETFNSLRKIRWKLNPTKSVFDEELKQTRRRPLPLQTWMLHKRSRMSRSS
jgi:predicted metal-dependent hydrolase